MANEGAKTAARDKKRAERREKRKAGAGSGKEKTKNPVVEEARTRYTEELRKQGTPEDQMRTKMRAHLKDVIKPAMSEAKATAKSKNLKGPARKKYVQDTLRSKLGLQK